MDIKAGQTVFIRSHKRGSGYVHEKAKVERVGNKFFYIGNSKYYIATGKLCSEYTTDTQVYLSEQDILDLSERESLSRFLRDAFGGFGQLPYTLDQLRKVKEIIYPTV